MYMYILFCSISSVFFTFNQYLYMDSNTCVLVFTPQRQFHLIYFLTKILGWTRWILKQNDGTPLYLISYFIHSIELTHLHQKLYEKNEKIS